MPRFFGVTMQFIQRILGGITYFWMMFQILILNRLKKSQQSNMDLLSWKDWLCCMLAGGEQTNSLKRALSMHNSSFIQQFIDIAALGVEHILSQFSHELKPHWKVDLREIFTKHPQAITKRTADLNGFTIIHGDVGSANILVPRQGNYPLYIIDRQPFNWSLTVWLGVYDIAYAIVLDWDIETRRQYEFTMLKRYHEYLIKNGVYNYTWEQLYNDYKLCVVMSVYIATEYFRSGVNGRWTHVWLSMLQRALTACDDLECYAIWRRNKN